MSANNNREGCGIPEPAESSASCALTAKTEGSAAYTPGPWLIVQHPDPECNAVAICEGSDPEYAGGFVTCWSHRGAGQANARLIAAAPDLLEALKMCVIERSEWLNEARSAIEKAVGQ